MKIIKYIPTKLFEVDTNDLKFWMNQRRVVRESLKSCRRNKFRDLEILVVNEMWSATKDAQLSLGIARMEVRVKYFIAWLTISVIIVASVVLAKELLKI